MSYADPVEHRLGRLNDYTLSLLKQAIDNDFAADLTSILRTALGTYTIKRSEILDPVDDESGWEGSQYDSTTLNGDSEFDTLSTITGSTTPSTIVEIRPFYSHISGPINLVSFPTPEVFALITGSSNVYIQDPPSAFSHLPQILDHGRVLWATQSRSIVQLSQTIAVKAGPTHALDYSEHTLLSTIAQRAPNIPAPRPLGIVQIGGMSFMFMSFLPGTTLEKLWPDLTKAQKVAVRRQLNQAMHQLRQVPYTPGTPLGSLSSPFTCKDTRPTAALPQPPSPTPHSHATPTSHTHTSPRAIYTVAGFNDFLFARPRARIAPGYQRWVRSLLRDTHRIALTHGDLRAHNVLAVCEGPNSHITLTGIVDWERGGWYPEYWELLKAMRTRTPDDESDWWDSLPDTISGYRNELAVDRVVEMAITVQ